MTDKPIEDLSKEYWLDKPHNITVIVWVLVAICIFLFFLDAFYHKHSYFEIENLFGFYGLFGFTVYVGLVLIAKWLRKLLMRPEDYYDNDV